MSAEKSMLQSMLDDTRRERSPLSNFGMQKVRKCVNCKKEEETERFKVCYRCKDKKIPETYTIFHWYCTVECQREHWNVHRKEHIKYEKKFAKNNVTTPNIVVFNSKEIVFHESTTIRLKDWIEFTIFLLLFNHGLFPFIHPYILQLKFELLWTGKALVLWCQNLFSIIEKSVYPCFSISMWNPNFKCYLAGKSIACNWHTSSTCDCRNLFSMTELGQENH